MISITEKISKNNLRALCPIKTAKVKAQHCSKTNFTFLYFITLHAYISFVLCATGVQLPWLSLLK
nr:MAG TPA: hypothetical protein [Bacteriophage sp.]